MPRRSFNILVLAYFHVLALVTTLGCDYSDRIDRRSSTGTSEQLSQSNVESKTSAETECGTQVDVAATPMTRQTRRHLSNNLNLLLGTGNINYAKHFTSEPSSVHGFKNDTYLLDLSAKWLDEYLLALETIIPDAIAADDSPLMKCNNTFDVCFDKIIEPRFLLITGRKSSVSERTSFKRVWEQAVKSSTSKAIRIQALLTRLLLMPDFLYREIILRDKPTGEVSLSGPEYAKRLAYFITGRLPDEELRRAGINASILKPKVAAKHIKRLMKLPVSVFFTKHHVEAWLGVSNILDVERDSTKYPTFTTDIKRYMRRETESFFSRKVRGNAPIDHLLISNETYLNKTLAGYYGYEGPSGDSFEPFETPDRQGIFSLGAWLVQHAKVLDDGSSQASPTARGNAFMLETCQPVPIFPQDGEIAALDEKLKNSDLSLREQLAQHVADPACAGCHKIIDEPGFAFMNFDGQGLLKKTDAKGNTIDSSIQLHTGEHFEGYRDMLEHFAQKDIFYNCVSRNFLIDALGRSLNKSETCRVDKTAAQLKNGGRFYDLISDTINHPSFRKKEMSSRD